MTRKMKRNGGAMTRPPKDTGTQIPKMPSAPDEIIVAPFTIDLAFERELERDVAVLWKDGDPRTEDKMHEVLWKQIDHMHNVLMQPFREARIALEPEFLEERCAQIRDEYECGALEAAAVARPSRWSSIRKDYERIHKWKPLAKSEIKPQMYLAARALPRLMAFRIDYMDSAAPPTHKFAADAMHVTMLFCEFFSSRSHHAMSNTAKARAVNSKRRTDRRADIRKALEAGESVNKRALAERFEVDVKTIDRDLASADLRKLASKVSK
jgi:hypothetical protein